LSGGEPFGISPVGLGARDTLRMEKGFLLSGQDFHWPGLGDDEDSAVESSFLSRLLISCSIVNKTINM